MAKKSGRYLRLIGYFKLFCAFLMIAAAIGLANLLGHDWSVTIDWLVNKLHLDPKDREINKLITQVTDVNLMQLAAIDAGAFLYGILYLVEGIGLIKGKHWAEYLTIVATSLFVPLEIFELIKHATLLKCGVLAVNLLIVLYLVNQLRRDRKQA